MFQVKQAQFAICLRHVLGSEDLLSRAISCLHFGGIQRRGYLLNYFVSTGDVDAKKMGMRPLESVRP